MSRFFDQSSSSESETDSEKEVIEQKPRPVTKYRTKIIHGPDNARKKNVNLFDS